MEKLSFGPSGSGGVYNPRVAAFFCQNTMHVDVRKRGNILGAGSALEELKGRERGRLSVYFTFFIPGAGPGAHFGFL